MYLRCIREFFSGDYRPLDSVSGAYGDSEEMSVLYANIFVGNQSMDELIDVIHDRDADVVVLVEFTGPHYDALASVLEEKYEYINRRNWSYGVDGTLFASRYPFEVGTSYVSGYVDLEPVILEYNEKEIVFNIVHTASPILEVFFEVRNTQLPMLASHLSSQKRELAGTSSRLLLGDFNVSPWSVYYESFVDDLGDSWINWSTAFGLAFTWDMPLFSFVRSHIDHVWGEGVSVTDLEVIDIAGSDHDGFYFEFVTTIDD